MNRILAAVSISIFGLGAGAYQTQVFSSDRAAPPTSPPVAQVGAPPEGPFGAGNVPQVDVDVNVNVSNGCSVKEHCPVIPGPPVAGEKLAPVIAEKPPKPKKSYLPCPKAGMVIDSMWADKLAQGCVTGNGDWLRGLARTDCKSRMIDIGPSAPQPLAWGIVGFPWHEGVEPGYKFWPQYGYFGPPGAINGETPHDYACRTGREP